jgi:hypothetical protein
MDYGISIALDIHLRLSYISGKSEAFKRFVFWIRAIFSENGVNLVKCHLTKASFRRLAGARGADHWTNSCVGRATAIAFERANLVTAFYFRILMGNIWGKEVVVLVMRSLCARVRQWAPSGFRRRKSLGSKKWQMILMPKICAKDATSPRSSRKAKGRRQAHCRAKTAADRFATCRQRRRSIDAGY